MIEKIWFEHHPLGWLLGPLLWPLSLIFRAVSRSRKQAYLSGNKASYRAPVPVIVVGNITAGGNGKTPVVIWLVERLQKLGYKPGVVSRGYGGKAPEYPLILEKATPEHYSGDEPKLIYKRTGAPVAVDPIRADAVKALIERREVDLIITDDGLQHYALQRDIEIVVVDGQRRFGNQKFIPAGPLREGLDRLQDVDFIITNGGDAQPGEISFRLKPSMAVNMVTGEEKKVSELRKLVAIAGIGHPPRFFSTLEELGADVIRAQGFADHQDFKPEELTELATQGEHLIMTEKDAVKCDSFARENWWYLPVSADFSADDEDKLLKKITGYRKEYGPSSA
ncbi:tetraacyldisaccharide 4'-kinase [Vibrio albus]|uniref:Tetraacyldisaccharide 4'-kinase n=1 Tax=Vibrio albus TaxID=2200953 RepID=A0A2U3BF23_9VIBR|nr:tetraacyldisaccharide 4'-kinase [Vibrio albus]PWI35381.1 tetraacyldisaccharide 4'-kinase [Vibrio albus]